MALPGSYTHLSAALREKESELLEWRSRLISGGMACRRCRYCRSNRVYVQASYQGGQVKRESIVRCPELYARQPAAGCST